MNKLLIALALLGVIFLFAQFIIVENTKDAMHKTFKVLKSYEEFEIREYDEMFVAKNIVPSQGYNETSRTGFRNLAGYIFGGNKNKQQIAMTSPVIMDLGDSVTMSFIMPEGITKSNAPAPSNQDVQLSMRPKEKVAVISFGGWASDEKINDKTKELKRLLEENNIEYYGNAIYMGYNPPYQLVGRKNEIALRILN